MYIFIQEQSFSVSNRGGTTRGPRGALAPTSSPKKKPIISPALVKTVLINKSMASNKIEFLKQSLVNENMKMKVFFLLLLITCGLGFSDSLIHEVEVWCGTICVLLLEKCKT